MLSQVIWLNLDYDLVLCELHRDLVKSYHNHHNKQHEVYKGQIYYRTTNQQWPQINRPESTSGTKAPMVKMLKIVEEIIRPQTNKPKIAGETMPKKRRDHWWLQDSKIKINITLKPKLL